MTNKLKQFILNYDMQKLVKSSQYYKEFMQSDEIVELQKKIDNEIDSIQKEWDIFMDIYINSWLRARNVQ